MAASDLRKRVLFFLAFSGIIILILILLPFSQTVVQSYILSQFAVIVTPEGKIVPTDGDAVGMMTETSVSLLVNLFRIAKILLWMALIISIVRFVGHLIYSTALRKSSQTKASSLAKTVVSVIVYIVTFFIVFQSQYPNVELAPLFTGSTIIGIVVGLALQDTLGNLFAGIALQADRPFQVGDVVTISNRGSGVVESVSWRGVKIRTFQNKLLVMSNSVMGQETIEVAPRDNLNARLVFFNTEYDNSPTKTAQVVREAVRQVDNVSPKIRPVVRIKNLGDHGIDWEVKYWAEDYTQYNDTDALVRQRIWYVFNREKLEFAYPTSRVIYQPKSVPADLNEYASSTSEYLRNIPIFTPLSEEELDRLAKGSNSRVFAPGEAIVRKGQEGNSMFVITKGAVNVQIPEAGGIKTVNHLVDGDFFGEMSLLTGEPRSANVVAAEETEVIRIEKGALKPIFEANSDLVKAICGLIEERKSILSQEVEETDGSAEATGKGVMFSIRNFFGLK